MPEDVIAALDFDWSEFTEKERLAFALARKLIVALWRFLEHGVVPEGAILKV